VAKQNGLKDCHQSFRVLQDEGVLRGEEAEIKLSGFWHSDKSWVGLPQWQHQMSDICNVFVVNQVFLCQYVFL
jgi:hypothetical protein